MQMDKSKLKLTRGHYHEYLGMTLDYLIPGTLIIDMTDYTKEMVESFPVKVPDKFIVPWTDALFNVNQESRY